MKTVKQITEALLREADSGVAFDLHGGPNRTEVWRPWAIIDDVTYTSPQQDPGYFHQDKKAALRTWLPRFTAAAREVAAGKESSPRWQKLSDREVRVHS